MPLNWSIIEDYKRPGYDPYGIRPQQKQTYLESAAHNIFDLLDAPPNIVRSGIGFAQTGDPEYLKNIVKVVTPFIESRKVPAEEITGSKNWFYNTAVDIAADPTILLLAGVGQLTKAGVVASRIKNLKHLAKVQRNIGDIAELTRTVESIAELKKLIPAGPIGVKRSLVTLKAPFIPYQVDLGDAKKVSDAFGKYIPKDSFQSLVKSSERLESRIRKGKARDIDGDKLADLQKTLVKTQEEMLDAKGVLSISTALKVDKFIRFFRNKFSTKSAAPFIHTLKDVIGLKKNIRLRGAVKDVVDAGEELKNIGDIANKAFLEKVIQTGEARFISNPTTRPDVQKKLAESLNKLETKTLLKIDKLGSGDADKLLDSYFSRVEKIKKQAVLRETRLKEAEKIWGESTPELRGWVTNHIDSLSTLISLENTNRVKTQLLESSHGFTSYVPRILTKEARKLKGQNEKLFFAINRDIVPRISASYKRKLLPESDILQVNEYVRKVHGIKFDFFDTNPINTLLNRKIQSINAISSSQLVQQTAKQFATGSKINGMSIKSFYTKFGLDTKDLPDNLFIPKNIVADLDRGHQQLFRAFDDADGFLTGVLRLNDMYVNQFSRMMLTVGWPAYAHKNIAGNLWNNTYAGMGLKDLVYYGKAARLQGKNILKKLGPEENKLFTEMIEHNIPNGGPLQELEVFFKHEDIFNDSWWNKFIQRPFAQTIESTYNITHKSKKLALTEGKFDPIVVGRKYNKFLEDNARIAHYLWAKDKGLTPFEAMKSVNKYLFNYKDLTPFEQQSMRPIFLFYTWMRKNIPLQLKAIARNPKIVAAYNDLTSTDDSDLPDYLRGSLTIPSPFNPNVKIGSLGVPLEDLNMLNVSDIDPLYVDQMSRVLTKVASRFSPTLTTPIELVTGEKLYTKKKLHDMGVFEFLTQLTPVSRLTRTAKEFSDSRTSLSDKAVNFMTGIRTYTIDPKVAAVATSRRAALGTGKVTKFDILIPKRKYKEDETTKAIIKHHKKLVAERNKG